MNNLVPEHADEHHSVEWATTRPIVSGLGGVISSGHPPVFRMEGTGQPAHLPARREQHEPHGPFLHSAK